MIVKVTFLDMEDKELTMLFGTSYKNWFYQFTDYVYRRTAWWDCKDITRCEIYRIAKVEKSNSHWVGYGGLKWCTPGNFQFELDREAEGKKLKKPRQYSDMVFHDDRSKLYKTRDFLKDRLRHLKDSSITEIEEAIKQGKEKEAEYFRLEQSTN
jgi:hypothetical protein